MIGCWNKSVILTYIGVAVAICGIALSSNMPSSLTCLAIAGVCDLFDGVIARKTKRNDTEKMFGIQLDSLADVISFGALPATILLSNSGEWPFIIIATAYVICSIARLAWFNVTTQDNPSGIYIGMPVTYIALILPVVYAVCCLISVQSIFSIILGIALCASAFLFILPFKNKRPPFTFIAIILVIVVISIVIAWIF